VNIKFLFILYLEVHPQAAGSGQPFAGPSILNGPFKDGGPPQLILDARSIRCRNLDKDSF